MKTKLHVPIGVSLVCREQDQDTGAVADLAGDIDVGLIPSIEYLRGGPLAIVPDLAIASRGPVTSVMLYTTKPIEQVKSIAMDTSSRTSAGLTRVLCREAWQIDPSFTLIPPAAAAAVEGCDAALVIGDPALFLDAVAAGLTKIDLGSEWTRMTGLPFVWAFWAGRVDALDRRHADALKAAGVPPVPERPTSWQTFLRAHWGAIAGADFFTTEVWTWRGLVTYYTVFVIDLASRRVQIVGSTPYPTSTSCSKSCAR
jgi:hypothetical protein